MGRSHGGDVNRWRSSWHTSAMAGRDDVHRLVDAVPEARLPVVEQVLRASLDGPTPGASRQFSSAGTLHAEHNLAERSEDILRDDDPGTDTSERGRPSA